MSLPHRMWRVDLLRSFLGGSVAGAVSPEAMVLLSVLTVRGFECLYLLNGPNYINDSRRKTQSNTDKS